jgi:hypothetical protein
MVGRRAPTLACAKPEPFLFLAVMMAIHGHFRLKPKTGVNARASWPSAEQKHCHDFSHVTRVSREPVPPYGE